jgi:hypothetical protein
MKRTLLTAGATMACAALVPCVASAAVVELGQTKTALVAPTCPAGVSPANCTIILTRSTAMETLRDGVAYPSTVKQAGAIVAFTIGLSGLSSSRTTAHQEIHSLDSSFGGTTRVAITVLRVTNKKLRHWKVVAESPVFHVQPYLGQVVQFPLAKSLPVRAGDVVALTTPTWAPVLSIDLTAKKFAYRQSRTTACAGPPATTAAQNTGQTATYGCNYPGTRVEYTATEVTNPVAVNPIHSRNRRVHSRNLRPRILGRTTGGAALSTG